MYLTEPEQATPVNSIKDVIRSSVKVPEFDKHLKKAEGHIGWNIVEITINSPKTLNDKKWKQVLETIEPCAKYLY